ncbi:decapping nuclease dom-3-like [Temnothorax americanus]|uniref:decapping nuclease dom-3-like n=1 Tax=Temnothorax americanus TaxID=1964332 RepID=UPI004068367E
MKNVDAKNDEWIICASKYRGTIYLWEFRPDERERGQDNATVSDKQISTGTNKFQQYIVANHPLHEPGSSSVPLNERGEFHCMFKANFSNVSLLYGAKIDAIFLHNNL